MSHSAASGRGFMALGRAGTIANGGTVAMTCPECVGSASGRGHRPPPRVGLPRSTTRTCRRSARSSRPRRSRPSTGGSPARRPTYPLRAASATDTSPGSTASTTLVFVSGGITGRTSHRHPSFIGRNAPITGLPRSLKRDTLNQHLPPATSNSHSIVIPQLWS